MTSGNDEDQGQGQGRAQGHDRAVLLVAGLADLAVSTLGSALGTVRGLLGRSDTAQLVEEAERDLIARGRLALDRRTAPPPAHLEVLARHVLARQARQERRVGGDV
ncbi:polyprenyl synthetase [Streptomyces sp. NPDC006339]|uniref:polyprenyl synthetase n=1 Tax=Streptomyces sp. NPDC006339 TaxID=3156755 RepID=UPI0033BE07F1